MRDAVIQLTASEARGARIAAMSAGQNDEAVEKLGRAFSDAGQPPIQGTMRFQAPPDQLTKVAINAKEHSKEKREKGYGAARDKYHSVARKIESQLNRQGLWTI